VYPHGGGVSTVCDGQWPVHRNTVVRFVLGTGLADVHDLLGYPVLSVPIGWPFCDMRPFRPSTPRKILFAPEHPMGDGWLRAGSRESNRRIHDQLVALGAELTVRWVQIGGYDVKHLGITPADGVNYQKARMNIAEGVAAIDEADVVVAQEGTFPSLAIARGCPTVMYGQIAPDDHHNRQGERPAQNFELYRDIVRYPYDADTDDLGPLLERACSTEATDWRERFVGPAFDGPGFVELFEKYAEC
jgi:hypothetical protein